MPEIRTDDGPRKLRAVWLGPDGYTLPFEWTYVQWAVSLTAVALGAPLGVLLLAAAAKVATGSYQLWFTGLIGVLLGGYAALLLAVPIMRGVTFDEPLRHKRFLLRSELGRDSRHRQAKSTEWVMPWPLITDLTVKNPPTPEDSL